MAAHRWRTQVEEPGVGEVNLPRHHLSGILKVCTVHTGDKG